MWGSCYTVYQLGFAFSICTTFKTIVFCCYSEAVCPWFLACVNIKRIGLPQPACLLPLTREVSTSCSLVGPVAAVHLTVPVETCTRQLSVLQANRYIGLLRSIYLLLHNCNLEGNQKGGANVTPRRRHCQIRFQMPRLTCALVGALAISVNEGPPGWQVAEADVAAGLPLTQLG